MLKINALLLSTFCFVTAQTYAMQNSPISKKRKLLTTQETVTQDVVAPVAPSQKSLDLVPDVAGFSHRDSYCSDCLEKRNDLGRDARLGSDDEVRQVVFRTSSMEARPCFPFRCKISLLKAQHRAAKQQQKD